MLQKNNLRDVSLVVLKKHKNEIKRMFEEEEVKAAKKMNIELIVISLNEDNNDTGAIILKTLDEANQIRKENLVLLSGDIILDQDLSETLDNFLINDGDFLSFFREFGSTEREVSAKGSTTSVNKIYGISENGRELVTVFDEEGAFKLKKDVMRHYPGKIILRTDLEDTSLYLMKRWLIRVINKDTMIDSIRFDLLPFLTKNQYKRQLLKYKHEKEGGAESEEKEMFEEIEEIFESEKREVRERVKILSSISKRDQGFYLNISSVDRYKMLNLQLLETMKKTKESLFYMNPESNRFINVNSENRDEISVDSCVFVDTEIGEKAKVRKSNIDIGVKLGKGVKLYSSVVLQGAEIGEE